MVGRLAQNNLWLWWVGGGLLWLYTVGHYLHGAFGYRGYGDFVLLLEAVRQWRATGAFASDGVYLYPPLFYLLNLPLAALSNEVAITVMLIVNQFLLVACLSLLAQALAPRPGWRLWLWVLLPVALNFRPLLLLLSMAKIELAQLTLLLGALVVFQRGRSWLTGSLVACSGMLKPLPLVLVGYWAWKRQWRVVAGWLLTIAVCVTVAGTVFGFQAVGSYFFNVALPRGENLSPLYWYENQSLLGVAARLFHPVQPNQFSVYLIQRPADALLGWGLRLALLLWLGVLLRPGRPMSRERVAGEWSVTITGMLLLSPFSRDYYAVFLMPAYLLLAHALVRREGGWRSPAGWCGVLSYLMVGQGFPLGIIRRLPSLIPGIDNFHAYLHYGIPTAGYLLLIMAWACYLREAGGLTGD